MSGPGIVNLYKALCQINGKEALFNSPSEITSAAIKVNPDSMSKETLHLFCQIFGSVTGTIALSTGCLGGIYIPGRPSEASVISLGISLVMCTPADRK